MTRTGSPLLSLLKAQFDIPASKDCLIFEYLQGRARRASERG